MFLKYLSALPYLLLIFFLTGNAFAEADSWTVEKHPTNSSLRFYWNDVATNPAMTIGTNNRVGINTNSPAQLFQINATASNPFVVTSAGNVGIGTTAPGNKLQISGDGTGNSVDVAQIQIKGAANSNKQLRIGYDTTNNMGWIQSILHGTTQTPLSLNPTGGNVGIGTITPAYKLDVQGSFEADIFYDRNNTAYYADPSNVSVFNQINANDIRPRIIYDLDNTGYYVNPYGGSQFNQVYSDGWFRSQGQTGWYSQDYGGGWHMTDATWIRAYSGKSVYTPGEVQATTIRANNNLCMGACVDHIPLYHDYMQFDWQPPSGDITDTYIADATYWRICYMRGASGFGDYEDAQIYRTGDQWRVWGRRGGWPALLRLACVR